MGTRFASQKEKAGVFFALGAFGFWGFLPIYFKTIQHVSPLEILCHRIVWSVPITALLIFLLRGWKELGHAVSARTVVGTLFLSALLVGTNWLIFIYAVSTDRIVEASLGYFINPLVNVLLGVVLLRERLRRWQAIAVVLAALGTLNQTIQQDGLPWISLALAFTFGFYGLLRKTVSIESVNGLFFETSLLTPFALGYLLYRGINGVGAFGAVDWQTTTLLSFAGFITSVPLVCFTSATRRLHYSTIGLLQYLAPSLQFLIGVFYYGDPFTATHMVTFAFIWSGLAIFVAGTLSAAREVEARS